MSQEETKTEDFGMSTWDDETPKFTPKKEYVKTDWTNILKLAEGKNQIRIVTNPFAYFMHKYRPVEDPECIPYADKIKCSLANGSCVICDLAKQTGLKSLLRTKRYYAGVIDRKTQSYKVLEVSPQLKDMLQELYDDEAWGDFSQYDITIKVTKGSPSGYYMVTPKGKTPLTATDLELKKNADFEDLKRKCGPSTPEYVVKRVATIDAKVRPEKVAENKASKPSSQVEDEPEDPTPESVENEGDDEEFNFPKV
jgi:hypothetical protein